ncbi:hypothetical protein ACFC0C_24845 [Streptomyces sp. NPDC056178]|uniref:hypothetical protein n=1 Tax=Streptomyces sp. NPDC056178 TaxID=3345735 RepID=UPI0035E04E3F
MPSPPISGGAAADRIAEAVGTPNPTAYGERANVTAFVVRRFVDRGLLADLSAKPEGTLHHPDQVAEVCRRENLAALVAADTPLGPEQAAARLRVRRADFDHMVRLGWLRSPQSIEVHFGTSRAGSIDVALYTTASVDAVVPAHPEVDGEQLRAVRKAGALRSRRCARPRQPPSLLARVARYAGAPPPAASQPSRKAAKARHGHRRK